MTYLSKQWRFVLYIYKNEMGIMFLNKYFKQQFPWPSEFLLRQTDVT